MIMVKIRVWVNESFNVRVCFLMRIKVRIRARFMVKFKVRVRVQFSLEAGS